MNMLCVLKRMVLSVCMCVGMCVCRYVFIYTRIHECTSLILCVC